jgi:N-methylhydantoinase A
MRIGIDIGGTFTDIVAARDGRVVGAVKLLSTPHNYSAAIAEGVGRLLEETATPAAAVETVIHGTTVATNAILEGSGARTMLLTTRGFRDVLELRRIRTPELYNLSYTPPRPLVARRHRIEITERLDAGGNVLVPLDSADVDIAIARCLEEKAEAVAVCLLHSYANPEHEAVIAARLRAALGTAVFVTASHEILPEIREYERTSTTVINAYIGPVVSRYLAQLVGVLKGLGIDAPVRVMQSNGGTLGIEAVLRAPATIIESGPAAGVVAGASIASAMALETVITVDMGGTTAKASLVESGAILRTAEYEVGAGINLSSQLVKGRGHALRLPVVDISEIGAGGGSIARLDAGGRLLVGPESAGSMPGPVAYGRGGTHPTLTDAMVTLGYLSAVAIAGGAVPIDAPAARQAVEKDIATSLGRSVRDSAFGIYRIAGAVMTRAVKAVTTMRGRDPRSAALIAFGGNGSLMAPLIADELSIDTIVIPALPGVFSACGLLLAPNERQLSQTYFRSLNAIDGAAVRDVLEALSRRAVAELVEDGADSAAIHTEFSADLRYKGQAYELTVPVPGDALEGLPDVMARQFHDHHRQAFGHSSVGDPVDLVSLRVVAREISDNSAVPHVDPDGSTPSATSRMAFFGGPDAVETAVINRLTLGRDGPLAGPLIIEEYDATTLVPPGWTARLGLSASIIVERQPA